MVEKLVFISILTMIIHMVETLSYAFRLAGVRVGKLAVALSLTGIIVLISRTSNLLQAPLTGKMVDFAKKHTEFDLERNIRIIIGSASIGTILAILLFPSAVYLAIRIINHFEIAGSIPKMITSVTITKVKHIRHHLRSPNLGMLKSLRIMGVPKRLLALNCIVSGIYTVGVLAALNASYMNPEFGMTASQSSGIINGLATIIMTILIDPQMALLTEKAMSHNDEKKRLGKIFGLLMVSRLIGTLLAQAFLIPASILISWVVRYI